MSRLGSAGIAVAGVGALALGGALLSGLKARAAAQQVDRDGYKSTPQLETERLLDEHDTWADRASILTMAGGVLSALGIGLLVVDRVLGDTRLDVEPTAAGAKVSVRW